MGKIREFLKKHAWVSYLLLAILAALDALVSIVFLYPNDFAPVGLQGFTTMIQYLFGISVGYIYSLVNAPMLIIAFFVLSRGYSFKNLSYILSFSAMTVVFQKLIEGLDLNWVEYVAVEPEQKIFAAVVYGVLFGVTYPLAVWLGGSTGGTDILAALVHRFKPAFSTVWVLFGINAGVAVMSYFVYGRELFPVILSVLCAFVSGVISDHLFRGVESALKFEIITDQPDALAREIIEQLEHGCTRIPATGMYSGSETTMLICVINKRQRVEMEQLISKYRGSFGFCSPVKSTYGRFDRIR
jgi:uncharacterized membrane-anchored protein YitT (DUF2179 family)